MSILKYFTILFAIIAIASCLDDMKSNTRMATNKRLIVENVSINEAKARSLQSEIIPVREEVRDSKDGVSIFKVNTNTKGQGLQKVSTQSEIRSTTPVVATSSPVPKTKVVVSKSKPTTTTTKRIVSTTTVVVPIETETTEIAPVADNKQRVLKKNASKNNMGEINKKEKVSRKAEKSKSLGKVSGEEVKKHHKSSDNSHSSTTTVRATTVRSITPSRSTTQRSTTTVRTTTVRSITPSRFTTRRSTTTVRATAVRPATTIRSTTIRSTTERLTTTLEPITEAIIEETTTVLDSRARIGKIKPNKNPKLEIQQNN